MGGAGSGTGEWGWKMKSPIIGIILALTLTGSAVALPARDATYFCNVKAAGGLRYDEQTKVWRSANFKPGNSFVLKLKFVASRTQKSWNDKDEPVNDFSVTLTEEGSNSEKKCYNSRTFKEIITISSINYINCNSSITEYTFNLESNRFLAAYLVGYVGGDDNNDDTPSISGGTCTKIN